MEKMLDVVIIGAGPAGSATAYYLARQGLQVLLLDKFDFPRDKTCGDGLTPRALDLLDEIGLLPDLLRLGRRVNGLEIFAPRGHSTAAPFPEVTGLPSYALAVPRLILDDLIRQQAIRSGAGFQSPVRVTHVAQAARGVVVQGERQGRPVSFKAALAILATGANLKLLLRLGLLHHRPPLMLAARAYFEGISGLADRFHFRFDGVPLPGYGWIFPLSDSAANVGAGFLPGPHPARRGPATPAAAFENFIRSAPLQELLASARRTGPVKGYPLRTDFPAGPTFAERMILVGEAAGLVNPLTGEGIEYALESGKMAAGHLAGLFAAGDLSLLGLAGYDRLLRQRFERLFRFCRRMRDLFLRPVFLNPLVSAATRHADLRTPLIDAVVGYQDLAHVVSGKTVLKASLALATELATAPFR